MATRCSCIWMRLGASSRCSPVSSSALGTNGLVGCTLEDDNGWKPYSHGPHENFKEHDLPPKLQGNIVQHVIFFRDVNMKDRRFFFSKTKTSTTNWPYNWTPLEYSTQHKIVISKVVVVFRFSLVALSNQLEVFELVLVGNSRIDHGNKLAGHAPPKCAIGSSRSTPIYFLVFWG